MKIESLQNSTIKTLSKLKNKKDRDLSGRFLVEGLHMIQEAAAAGILEHVYQLDTLPVFKQAGVTFCTQLVLNKLSAQKSDAKYIGVCHRPDSSSDQECTKLLLLDRVQDPGNLGTLIRSAHSFGIQKIICSTDCADAFGPKALQSSQGALFHLPVEYTDLLSVVERLKERDVTVFGAALHQNSIELNALDIPEKFAVMIGNEGQGICEELLGACSKLVHIEMQTFESLNAAIAGSILMYAFQFPTASR